MTQQTYYSGLLFTQAHKLVRGRINEILEPYGLNPSYWSILGAASATSEGSRPAHLAKLMGVKAPLVTMLSNELIELGLIERVAHPTDKRAKLLIATKKGKQIAARIEQDLSDEIDALLNGLSSAEIASFQRALETIIHNASA